MMPSFPHEHSFCANGSRCHMTFEKTSMVLLRLKSRNLLLGGFIMPQFHLKSHGTDDTMRSSEPPTSSIHITMCGKCISSKHTPAFERQTTQQFSLRVVKLRIYQLWTQITRTLTNPNGFPI